MPDPVSRLAAALADRYAIEHELGQGGMATVYIAEDLKHHRKVAIKVLRPELAAALGSERFLREIEIAAGLAHPHVLALHDSGTAGGFLYYVMPYVAGESLRSRIAREGALPVPEACRILRDMTEALAYAHRRNVVHRDVKPENVLLTEGHALVADFGVAKAVRAAASAAGAATPLTVEGTTVGTPAYMAPEQVVADPQTDARADLYALGVVAYEMLTGRLPFTGMNVQQVLVAHIADRPPPLTVHRPSVPPAVAAAVMRCLEKHPADRPQSGEELLPIFAAAAMSGDLDAARGPVRPWRRIAAAVGGTALVVVVAGLLLVRGGHRAGALGPTPRGGGAGHASVRTVAVLPFQSLGGDSSNGYLGDGVSEEILRALSRLPGLAVAGRTSSFRYRGPGVDARAVGDSLGVGALLAGTIQRAGNEVRVTAELVDTRTGMQLWSDQYDRQMGELFALEDDIAQAITSALQVRLGGGASLVRRGTTSAEAHDLVLRANGLALQGDEANLNRAIALYQQALAIDSTYAEAWARLAFAYAYVADAYRAPREMVPLAEQAAQRALALDDSLALAHSALGTVRYSWQWRFAEGRHELERALALDPSSPEAHLDHAQYLMAIDQDIAGGERELELAAARDPLSPDIVRWQETAALVRGETDRALRLAGRIRELSGSGVYYGFNRTAEAYWAAGRWADCVKASDMDTVSSAPAAAQLFLAICSAHLGNGVVARRLLGRIEAQPYVDQMWRGAILYALGDTTGTLAALSRAIEDRSANILGARSLPWYRGLRHDPRFVALLARIGLPPSGPPRQPAR